MSALPRGDTHPAAVAGQHLDRGPSTHGAHGANAAVDTSPHPGQRSRDAQSQIAGVGTIADRASKQSSPISGSPDQRTSPPADPTTPSVPSDDPGRPEDVVLAITADLLDDLERVRIATENRVRSLTQVKGLNDTPVEARMSGIVDGIKALEHDAELELRRALRAHPLGPWVRSAKGVGEKQAGRLIAAIGDPYIHGVTGEPRTVSQLWAYSGYHVLRSGQLLSDAHVWLAGADPSLGGDAGHTHRAAPALTAGVAPSRARGQKANWNADAKMRAFLVAESCLKQLRKPCMKPDGQAWADHDPADCRCSPYRIVYDEGRRKYNDSVHQAACRRCGPSGTPAPIGSALSDGHTHARALRLVAKAVLRDLWIAARAVHGEGA